MHGMSNGLEILDILSMWMKPLTSVPTQTQALRRLSLEDESWLFILNETRQICRLHKGHGVPG